MEVSKRDIESIVKYLELAAKYFNTESKQLFINGVSGSKLADTARRMRRLAKKLNNRLPSSKTK